MPKPDLVVSGINRGSNLGWDVIVSGTVGAAVQGFVRGYPTIAISVGSVQSPRFDVAADVVADLARSLADSPAVMPPYFLNVNVPNEPVDKIAGVKVTYPGRAPPTASRCAPRSRSDTNAYWISRNRPVLAGGVGSDIGLSQGQQYHHHADGHGLFHHRRTHHDGAAPGGRGGRRLDEHRTLTLTVFYLVRGDCWEKCIAEKAPLPLWERGWGEG